MDKRQLAAYLKKMRDWREKAIKENPEIASVIQYFENLRDGNLTEYEKEQVETVKKFLDPKFFDDK